MTKVVTKITTKPSALRVQVVKDQVDHLLDLNLKRSELEEQIRTVRDGIQQEMTKLDLKEVTTKEGRAMLVERNTFTWSIDALKQLFGKGWTKFVKTDGDKVKAELKLAEGKVLAEQIVRFANVDTKIVLDVR